MDFLEVEAGRHLGQQGPDRPVRQILQTDQGCLEFPQDQSQVLQQMDLTPVHFP